MWEVVLLTGVLIIATSLYLMVRVEQLPVVVNKVLASRWLYLAAFFRLMLGAALIASAHTVQFPREIAIIGWLIALGGLLLVAVPQGVWLRLARWLIDLPLAYTRAYLLLGLILGGLILYIALA